MRTFGAVFPRRRGTVLATLTCRPSTSSARTLGGNATSSSRTRSRSAAVTPRSRWDAPDMDCSGVPIGELLPHGPEMTVIDRLVEYSPQRSIATVVVTEQSPFFVRSGVPAWVGIEYMAQTIAAHAGFEARLRGEKPAIGFLLGTRAYESEVGEFALGSALTITVEPVLREARLAAF